MSKSINHVAQIEFKDGARLTIWYEDQQLKPKHGKGKSINHVAQIEFKDGARLTIWYEDQQLKPKHGKGKSKGKGNQK